MGGGLPRQYPVEFGRKIAALFHTLKPRADYVTDSPETDAIELWKQWEWGDLWDDAQMRALVRYLYGCSAVRIPAEWKAVLPREL